MPSKNTAPCMPRRRSLWTVLPISFRQLLHLPQSSDLAPHIGLARKRIYTDAGANAPDSSKQHLAPASPPSTHLASGAFTHPKPKASYGALNCRDQRSFLCFWRGNAVPSWHTFPELPYSLASCTAKKSAPCSLQTLSLRASAIFTFWMDTRKTVVGA